MMLLTPDKQQIANKQRELILKHCKNHRKCNDCGGTGLGNVTFMSGDYTWDGITFCDKCKGIGFLSWKETVTMKLCPKCKGGGRLSEYEQCDKCKGRGILDWLQYMIGGVR